MVSVVFLIRVYSRQFAAKRFFRFTAITRDVGDYGDLALSHLLPYSQFMLRYIATRLLYMVLVLWLMVSAD